MKYIKKFENYKNIEIEKSGGINCDNTECGWSDQNVNTEDYDSWINKPCPKCGENLLTQEDADQHKKLVDAINLINSIPPEELEKLTKNLDTDDIIDAYLKLKTLGFTHEGDENWSVKPTGFK